MILLYFLLLVSANLQIHFSIEKGDRYLKAPFQIGDDLIELRLDLLQPQVWVMNEKSFYNCSYLDEWVSANPSATTAPQYMADVCAAGGLYSPSTATSKVDDEDGSITTTLTKLAPSMVVVPRDLETSTISANFDENGEDYERNQKKREVKTNGQSSGYFDAFLSRFTNFLFLSASTSSFPQEECKDDDKLKFERVLNKVHDLIATNDETINRISEHDFLNPGFYVNDVISGDSVNEVENILGEAERTQKLGDDKSDENNYPSTEIEDGNSFHESYNFKNIGEIGGGKIFKDDAHIINEDQLKRDISSVDSLEVRQDLSELATVDVDVPVPYTIPYINALDASGDWATNTFSVNLTNSTTISLQNFNFVNVNSTTVSYGGFGLAGNSKGNGFLDGLVQKGLIKSPSYSLNFYNFSATLFPGVVDSSNIEGGFYSFPIIPPQGSRFVDDTYANNELLDIVIPSVQLDSIQIVNDRTSDSVKLNNEPLGMVLDTRSTYTYLPLDVLVNLAIQTNAYFSTEAQRWIVKCEAIKNANSSIWYSIGDLKAKIPLATFIEPAVYLGNPLTYQDGSRACYLAFLPNTLNGINSLGTRVLTYFHIAVDNEGRNIAMSIAKESDKREALIISALDPALALTYHPQSATNSDSPVSSTDTDLEEPDTRRPTDVVPIKGFKALREFVNSHKEDKGLEDLVGIRDDEDTNEAEDSDSELDDDSSSATSEIKFITSGYIPFATSTTYATNMTITYTPIDNLTYNGGDIPARFTGAVISGGEIYILGDNSLYSTVPSTIASNDSYTMQSSGQLLKPFYLQNAMLSLVYPLSILIALSGILAL